MPLIVYYSAAYAVRGSLETVTKSRHVADFIKAGLAGDVTLQAPRPVTREELQLIHSEAYITKTFENKKARLASGPWSQALLASILASTGGMRDAVGAAMKHGRSGSLSSGLHHAGRDYGSGFCHFNGLALAALEALQHVAKVGILDLDAHAGGGTFDILQDHPQVYLADVTVSPFDDWKPKYPERHFYQTVDDSEDYLPQVALALKHLEGIKFLIYNAGMDTHEKAGGLRGIRLFDYTLKSQFRCSGSDAFINWINHTLGIEETAHHFWEAKNPYEFKIFDTPEELEKAIHTKVGEKAKARMAAGFCWKWSDPDVSGNLLDDVVIGDWKRPWDAKPGATRLAKGIPPAALWAYDPNGIGQIGCVYTAQGFEFDYIGVIIGKDLIYRNGQGWVGVKEESCDSVVKRSKEKFVDLVKNTYRVLLTRGMKVT